MTREQREVDLEEDDRNLIKILQNLDIVDQISRRFLHYRFHPSMVENVVIRNCRHQLMYVYQHVLVLYQQRPLIDHQPPRHRLLRRWMAQEDPSGSTNLGVFGKQ